MSAAPRRSHRSRGYTFVELMMALALLAVSVVGIISLQKVTVVTNGHAKNLAMAQRIAQAWAGQLQMDSTQWVTTRSTTNFLTEGNDNQWKRPAENTTRGFGAAFDALGNPLPDTASVQAAFCAHIRLTSLTPTTTVTGNDMLRAEIRVFWLRPGRGAPEPTSGICKKDQDLSQITAIGAGTDLYHYVYQTIGLRQHYQI